MKRIIHRPQECLTFLALSVLLLPAPAVSREQKEGSAVARATGTATQAINQEYTALIRSYTTEKFFLTELVDHLPASDKVPSPDEVIGYVIGTPEKLTYSKDVNRYMRELETTSPRVKVFSIGLSDEGREVLAVAVSDEANINRLDRIKQINARLADPRTIKDDAEAAALIAETKPIYWITGSIHSGETGSVEMLMELAYRLAVGESPFIQNIRRNAIVMITPMSEVDGHDRQVDVYRYRKENPDRQAPPLIYWGKYVAHDNNRDAMGLTLKLTQNVLNTFIDWKALVLHDLHESGSFLYDNTIGNGPYNAWLDPILTNEWHLIGWNNVNEMTRMGMPGVFAWGTFDTWSPGYLFFIAATHNGISRLYETFGNGGSADTEERTISGNATSRTWFRQNPPLSRVMWSLRNNNNYEQTGIIVSLNYIANNRIYFLRNFYDKSKRSILKPKNEGPAAYVLPADDPRLGTQAELLRVLQKQRVEISRATAPFTVKVPARPQAAGGRGGRGGRGGGAAAAGGAQAGEAPARTAKPAPPETREFPAGSYIIRMDQPYSRIADTLLDYQYWAPNDAQARPYDDTGWTFPEGFGVKTVRITDTAVLDAAMERVQGEVKAPSGVSGQSTVFAINHNADNSLITLRYRLRNADIRMAEEPFESNGMKFNRGSFIIRGVSQADLDKVTSELGLKAHALAAEPSVPTHAARAARVAILHQWSSTQAEGWWRQAFDIYEIPYDYIDPETVKNTANLREKYDVIIFGPGGGRNAVDGTPMWRNPIPYKNTPDTPNIGTWAQTDDTRIGMGLEGLIHLQNFIDQGGVFIGSNSSAEFAIDNNLTYGVSANSPGTSTRVDGSLLRTRIVDDASPIVYGVPDNLAMYSSNGSTFSVSATVGGGGRGRGGGGGGAPQAAAGGGRGGGGGGGRPTGRGTPDDPDVVQGFPLLEGSNLPPQPVRQPTQPWQYSLPTDEQLKRNPANLIPPEFRPRVAVRFDAQNNLLVSGLLSGGSDIAQRPVVVDVPVGKGHVVLFANNPIYRGETIGSYFMVFNTILNFDSLNAGRELDEK